MSPPDWFSKPTPVSFPTCATPQPLSRSRSRPAPIHRPELAKAAWDWGFGDWESALGAASHTGNHEIAEYLMHGITLRRHAELGGAVARRGALEVYNPKLVTSVRREE